ncbi:MAG: SirB2 family protein [Gammaproteobacteria bacterium]
MEWFDSIKIVHVSAVLITASFFILRGVWMLQGSLLLQKPFVRVAPHVNDTVLFGSALTLAWLLGISPASAPWLGAKIIGLVVYILLGHIALRRGPTRRIRGLAFAGALAALSYILAVARCRDPLACLGS